MLRLQPKQFHTLIRLVCVCVWSLSLAAAFHCGAWAISGTDDVSLIQNSLFANDKTAEKEGFAVSRNVVEHILSSHAPHGSAKCAGDELHELAQWINSNGGHVDDHLYGDMTRHGGSEIRGVVTDASIINSALLEIPKKLWLTLENFPSFADAVMPATEQCEDIDMDAFGEIRLAAAIATETRKGRESFYYPYIRSLPIMSDFESFLPTLIDEPLKTEFASLPIVAEAIKEQLFNHHIRRACFLQWKEKPSSPAADLTWEELLLPRTWMKTRKYDGPLDVRADTDSLIPFADMANTESPHYINTHYEFRNTSFHLEEKEPLKHEESASGRRELYDEYCGTCDNERMLGSWGVYLESNPNHLDRSKVNCAVHSRGALKTSMEATLNLSSWRESSTLDKWVSPRCRKSVMSEPQGPLRCALGRLTWEYCAEAWGLSAI